MKLYCNESLTPSKEPQWHQTEDAKLADVIFVQGLKDFQAARKLNPGALISDVGIKSVLETSHVLWRQRLAEEYGCTMNELDISPLQYRMNDLSQCQAFAVDLKLHRHKYWQRDSISATRIYSPGSHSLLHTRYLPCQDKLSKYGLDVMTEYQPQVRYKKNKVML